MHTQSRPASAVDGGVQHVLRNAVCTFVAEN